MIGDIWQWTPFMFIVLLAVPEGQSVEQVEAATLDGVSMGLWAFVILFPLYWILITSVKLPIDVNNGPFYLLFVDSQPSDHAWKYIFFDLRNDTLRPYMNTVIISLASTALALILGSAAAYALTRFVFHPKVGAVLDFVE